MFWDDNLFLWVSAVGGLMLNIMHAPRIPTFYAAFVKGENMNYNIPAWVFFPVWLLVVGCDTAFAVLFFRDNSDFNTIYQAAAWVFFANVLLCMTWNRLFFDMICFYGVAFIAVLIMACHVALLALAIAYGDQHWFTLVVISAPVAWTTFAAILSFMLAYRLAAKLKDYKIKVGLATQRLYDQFLGTKKEDPSMSSAMDLPPAPASVETLPEPVLTSNSRHRYPGQNTVFT